MRTLSAGVTCARLHHMCSKAERSLGCGPFHYYMVFSLCVSAAAAAAQPAPAATRSMSQLTRPALQNYANGLPVCCSGGRGGGRGGRGGIDKRGGGRCALLPFF